MKKIILLAIILLAITLRFYKLGSTPPSLYWDEVSLGYNAYSILKTGHDEFGKFLPTTNFAAFGDYKPPGYVYLTVPSIFIFGLNEFAVRFPSALFGVLTVLLAYLLAKKLFEKESIAFLAATFLAISPWHVQLSRAAFEANVGLFFSCLGIYAFIKFAKDKPVWIALSALSFLAALYTFTGQRLFVPLILIVLVLQFKQAVLKQIKLVTITALLSGFIFWPLFVFATQTLEGRLRFEEVTIFKDLEPINRSTRYRDQDAFSWFSAIVHNRRLLYTREYLIHYFDAFKPTFLFTRGDENPRFSTREVGQLYIADLPLILFGLYFLISKKHRYRLLVLGWLLVSPLGPAMARETPHALRMIHILPTYQLIAAFGLYNFYQIFRLKKLLIAISVILIAGNLLYFLHMYYLHWPQNYSGEWQYGYKEAVLITKEKYNEVDHVVVTKSLGRPYIYFLFYMQFDPRQFWQNSNVEKDQFRFINVNGFDKFIFTEDHQTMSMNGKTLYISKPGQLPQNAQKLKTINKLDNSPVFDIGEVTK